MQDTKSHTVTWDIENNLAGYIGLSGLEAMRRNIEEGSRRTPIGALMNFRLVSADHGVAVLEGTPGVEHTNPLGIVHGGFAATLLDAALWSAVQSTLEAGFINTTLELKVNYTRPMNAMTGTVTCEGRVVHRGSKVATAEATLKGPDGKLYAHGTSTLLISKM